MDYALQVSGTYDHVLAAAQFAKQRGLVALALPDHYLMALSEEEAKTADAPDPFVQLGGLARETDELELVMLVSPITFRHPAVLAKMAVTLDRMSGGRFMLGVGTGWMDLEHEVFGIPYPDRSTRFAMFEDALGYLAAAFDPEFPGYEGTFYSLKAFPLAPAPTRKIPIIIGGTGKHKTPLLAGTFADEFNIYPGADITDRIQRFRDAATASGRDPDAIRMSSSGQVVAARTHAEFEDIMNERAASVQMTRDELDAYFDARQTPRGTYDQVREQLEGLAELGITRFYVQGIFAPGDMESLFKGLGIT
jgi:alkanesulfonate monooxygenase SsuD/methylene tetrahydromethanopterin reductase-like flavin-dependent oxidoreductase (luciferase family)